MPCDCRHDVLVTQVRLVAAERVARRLLVLDGECGFIKGDDGRHARELERNTMSVDGLIAKFGQSLTIYERTESVDAGGAYTRVYATAEPAVVVTVYLQPATPNESMVNGAIRASTSLTAYVNAIDGSSLATGQRLVGGDPSIMYEITGFRQPDMRSGPDLMAYFILALTAVEGET